MRGDIGQKRLIRVAIHLNAVYSREADPIGEGVKGVRQMRTGAHRPRPGPSAVAADPARPATRSGHQATRAAHIWGQGRFA